MTVFSGQVVSVDVVHVAVAVITDEDKTGKKVLIAKRPDHVHKGGLWEFPGGKVENTESVLEALTRELKEELAISVLNAAPLLKVQHDYPEKSVLLDVWEVTQFSGSAIGNEGQPVAWVPVDQLNGYQFPEANHPILDELRKLGRDIIPVNF